MKLVAITRVLNEADIVEAFARHAAALVDHHIFLDNGSSDATVAILSALRDEALGIEIHHSDAVVFAQREQNNFLFRRAAIEHRADWVVPLDADEFFVAPDGASGMRSALAACTADAIKVRVREYVPTPKDDPDTLLIPARITSARATSETNRKVIARGCLAERGADLQPGSHSIKIDGQEVAGPTLTDSVYAHFAVRSAWQWMTKFIIGWSKVLAGGPTEVAKRSSEHYRDPFNILMRDPAHILRNPVFMAFQDEEADLTVDPIHYVGGDLRYTLPVDHEMRAVQGLTTYLERLSRRHGELREAVALATLALSVGKTP